MAVGYVEVPEGWRRQGSRGFGPFVTREVFRLPDGTRLLWDSRWHRKHAGRVPGGSTWWAPFAMDWWMGILFAIGSVCFALGSFPLYATAVGVTPDNITFFVGSIFFTTASFLQYMEVAGTPTDLVEQHRNGLGSLLRIRHRRIDWWAAGIQLIGTVWFNRTTLSALLVGLGASDDTPPDLASRCAGLHLLPGRQLVGLGRGMPWALRLAALPDFVVDHRAQSGGLGRLRRVGGGVLRHLERPAPQPGADESGHLRGCRLLPGRRRAAAPRAHPGGSGHGTAARGRHRVLSPAAATAGDRLPLPAWRSRVAPGRVLLLRAAEEGSC